MNATRHGIGALRSHQSGGSELFVGVSALPLPVRTMSGGVCREDMHTLIPQAFRMRGFGDYEADSAASSLKLRDHKDATDLVCFQQNQREEVRDMGQQTGSLAADPGAHQQNYVAFPSASLNGWAPASMPTSLNQSLPLDTTRMQSVQGNFGVRRLMPVECERLQGFSDGWTDLPQSDSIRYRQLGNAVAVPVATWIAKRIMEVEVG